MEKSGIVREHAGSFGIGLEPLGELHPVDFDNPHSQTVLVTSLSNNIIKLLRAGDKAGGGRVHEKFPYLNELIGGDKSQGGHKSDSELIYNTYMIAEILLPNEVPSLVYLSETSKEKRKEGFKEDPTISVLEGQDYAMDYEYEVVDQHMKLTRENWQEVLASRKYLDDPRAFAHLDIDRDIDSYLYIDEGGHVATQAHFDEVHPGIKLSPYTRPASKIVTHKEDVLTRNSGLVNEAHFTTLGWPIYRIGDVEGAEHIPPIRYGTTKPGGTEYPGGIMTEEQKKEYGVRGELGEYGYGSRGGGPMENYWYFPTSNPGLGMPGSGPINPHFQSVGVMDMHVPAWENLAIDLDPAPWSGLDFIGSGRPETEYEKVLEGFVSAQSIFAQFGDDVPLEDLLVQYLQAFKVMVDQSPHLKKEILLQFDERQSKNFPGARMDPYVPLDLGLTVEELIEDPEFSKMLDEDILSSLKQKKNQEIADELNIK